MLTFTYKSVVQDDTHFPLNLQSLTQLINIDFLHTNHKTNAADTLF